MNFGDGRLKRGVKEFVLHHTCLRKYPQPEETSSNTITLTALLLRREITGGRRCEAVQVWVVAAMRTIVDFGRW